MPTGFLSSKQRVALDAFPEGLDEEEWVQFFRLSETDRRFVAGFGDGAVEVALMLGALKMLGFVPTVLPESAELAGFVAGELKPVTAYVEERVAVPERSRRHRFAATISHAGWRRAGASDLKLLEDWLLERAMEHDKPEVLFGLTLDWLRVERLVRPGITVLERAVAKARERAWDETFDRLSVSLTEEQIAALDRMLEVRVGADVSTLAWL